MLMEMDKISYQAFRHFFFKNKKSNPNVLFYGELSNSVVFYYDKIIISHWKDAARECARLVLASLEWGKNNAFGNEDALVDLV
mmetsp:Transcript_15017/g.14911  ORF Transcript_15017/g.14911 Transcript_15017/m.14911 type:complete len:83 (-) Transcript_15017:26-274(-)